MYSSDTGKVPDAHFASQSPIVREDSNHGIPGTNASGSCESEIRVHLPDSYLPFEFAEKN